MIIKYFIILYKVFVIFFKKLILFFILKITQAIPITLFNVVDKMCEKAKNPLWMNIFIKIINDSCNFIATSLIEYPAWFVIILFWIEVYIIKRNNMKLSSIPKPRNCQTITTTTATSTLKEKENLSRIIEKKIKK